MTANLTWPNQTSRCRISIFSETLHLEEDKCKQFEEGPNGAEGRAVGTQVKTSLPLFVGFGMLGSRT